MNIKVIIGAAGNSLRWENYMGVPKQLAPVVGEPLIHQTIHQLESVGLTNIAVMSNDSRMVTPPAVLEPPLVDINKSMLPGCCIAHTYPHWCDGDNIILFGDVCWHDDDIQDIALMPKLFRKQIQFLGHQEPHEKHNPEIFGVFIPQEQIPRMVAAIQYVAKFRPINPGSNISDGWMLYRKLHGRNIKFHKMYGDFMECDPATEDFDHPSEYDNWRKTHDK